jgi:ubiquitin C-terminal hydrolase
VINIYKLIKIIIFIGVILLPSGLINEGNNCYVNCILQALSSSTYFVKYLKEVVKTCLSKANVNFTFKKKLILTRVTLELLTKLQPSNNNNYKNICGSSVILFHLLSNLPDRQQQDAQELLQLLISALETEK